ncbi:MAG: 4-hydroxybenzoate octaprenyltransferase, partial [Burkholderiales bacterium]
ALLILAATGKVSSLGWAYWLGLAAAAGISLYHYALIHNREREKCFKAFLHNSWFGAVVFAGLAADYAIR